MVTATIDMRCGSQALCPAGFECTTEIEHGPPITFCESRDPTAVCPPGFETKQGYGPIFCTPPAGIGTGARTSHAEGAGPVRSRRTSRPSEGGRDGKGH